MYATHFENWYTHIAMLTTVQDIKNKFNHTIRHDDKQQNKNEQFHVIYNTLRKETISFSPEVLSNT